MSSILTCETNVAALGTHITGVDANTYSITGDSFSTIVLPGEHSQTSVTLQEDDCSLAYEFVTA
jgi:hypothetical protein